jgi:uncharacterized SAM-binding protein YcdF (DUF218 family)
LNSLLGLLGIESWKPLLSVLFLPPVPLLLLLLVGARLLLPRRGLGWSLIVLSVALLWLSACSGTERLLVQFVLRPPPALAAGQVEALKARYAGRKDMAIVVLGGGAQPFAPEYGVSNLKPASVERLRYGLWLGRETGLPLAFSGGVGWGAGPDATPEAQIAARIARQEFGRPLQWIEDRSRDTRQNAGLSVALLGSAGVRHVVLVTHGYHMPRALRAFREAAGDAMTVEAAPMGLGATGPSGLFRWLPTAAGLNGVHNALHEVAGLAAGA